MKQKIIYLIIASLLLCTASQAQQQFTKQFDISFDHVRMDSVLYDLAATQTDLKVSTTPAMEHIFITLQLKNVTLDEAMDQVLAKQSIYHDYEIIRYSEHYNNLSLLKGKATERYFDRIKFKHNKFYHIGDKLPDKVYAVSNYMDSTIRLTALKKKLIILDLWGVHCSGCILAMPHMEALQKQFNDQVQVILVTKDSKGLVAELKRRVKIVRDCKLPSITGENDLASIFDYITAPHQVWLDGNGEVAYSTNKDIAEVPYIRDYLAGKRMNLHEEKDTIMDDDLSVPVAVSLQPINKGNFIISSYLAPHNETKYHYGMGGFSDTATLNSIRVMDVDMLTLYKNAYLNMEPIDFSDTRIIRNFNHPEKYTPDFISDKNVYDYEMTIKDKQIPRWQFERLMQQELDVFFGVKSSLQTRKIPCYILKRIGNTVHLEAKQEDLQFGFNGNMLNASYCDLSAVINRLNEHRVDKKVLVDETGLNPKMKITCNFNMDFENHFSDAQRSLAKYGLTIIKGTRSMKCIVLDDAKLN